MNRVQGRPFAQKSHKSGVIDEMRRLLGLALSPVYWPPQWGRWEMRDVEHTLCEFDKYERAVVGDGTPKQRYSAH